MIPSQFTLRQLLLSFGALNLLLASTSGTETSLVDNAVVSVVRVVNIISIGDPEAVRRELPLFQEIDLKYLGQLHSMGSGFVINKEGAVVTNAHVVETPSDLGLEAGYWFLKLTSEALQSVNQSEAVKAALVRQLKGRDTMQEVLELFKTAGEKLVAKNAIVLYHYVARQPQAGEVEILKADLLHEDKGADLAILHATGLRAPPLTLNISKLSRGDVVFSLGFPVVGSDAESEREVAQWIRQGKMATVTSPSRGLLRFTQASLQPQSQVRQMVSKSWGDGLGQPDVAIVEHDVKIGHGDSGGPLLNSLGQVVGVNAMVMGADSVVDNVRMSLHSNELHQRLVQWHIPFLPPITKRPPVQRPWMLIALVFFASLIALGAMALAFVALRRPAAAAVGRTMVLNWIAEARGRSELLRGGGSPGRSSMHGRENRGREAVDARSLRPGGSIPRNRESEPSGRYRSYELEQTSDETGGTLFKVVLDGGAFARGQGQLVVGRSADRSDVVIDHRNISKQQAAFRVRGNKLFLEDLASSNGTQLNGRKLEPHASVAVEIGDTIVFGRLTFRLREARVAGDVPRPTAMQRSHPSHKA